MHFAAAFNRQQRLLFFSLWEKVARQGRMRVLFSLPTNAADLSGGWGQTLFGTIGDMDVAN